MLVHIITPLVSSNSSWNHRAQKALPLSYIDYTQLKGLTVLNQFQI